MYRKSTGVLVFLLVVAPAAMFAQTQAPQIVRTLDLVTPPGSAVSGLAHVEDIRIGAARQVHIVVTTNDTTAELTFDGRTMRFGDGYTLVRETLADAPGVNVLRLTGTAPDGESESAMIVTNSKSTKATGSSVGIERMSELLSKSVDVRVVASVLPFVGAFPTGSSQLAARVSAGDCLVATVIVAGAATMLVSNCSSGNVLGCAGSALLTGAAGANMAKTCPDNGAGDGTIGWG